MSRTPPILPWFLSAILTAMPVLTGTKWRRQIFGTAADPNSPSEHGRRTSASCDLR
jgi:hypothetical protein